MRHLLLAALLASPLLASAASGTVMLNESFESGTVVLAGLAAVLFIALRRNRG